MNIGKSGYKRYAGFCIASRLCTIAVTQKTCLLLIFISFYFNIFFLRARRSDRLKPFSRIFEF